MSTRRDLTVWIALFFFLLWALLTHAGANSWNDASRLASAEALVRYGTWAIEDTAFGQSTGDRVFLRGHFYSDKPPLLSLLAAGVYAILRRGFGLTLDPRGCDPLSEPCYCFAVLRCRPPDWAYYLVTLAVIGLPSALMLALFYRSTAFFDLPNSLALPATLVLGLGTLVLPYSLVLNNHLPSGVSLMIALYALIRARGARSAPARWLLVAGFAAALALNFDLAASPFLPILAVYALLRYRRHAWPFLLGGLLGLGLLAGLDWWAVGDPLPPTMHAAGWDYPGSPFTATPLGTTPAPDILRYALRMLIGDHGLFGLTPVLVWPVAGLALLLCKRDHPLWGEAAAVALACLAMLLGLILTTDEFGGLSYGTRWFTDLTPVLFFFAAQPALYRSVWRKALFTALVAVSVLAVWQGALSPWATALPPFRLIQYAASTAGRYLESQPFGTAIYTTVTTVPYLPVSPAHAWRTSLRAFDPASSVLPTGDPDHPLVYVLSADDRVTHNRLAATFPQGEWSLLATDLAMYRVPAGADRVRPAQSVRAEFAGRIQLLGCDPPPASVHPGDMLTVRLYWQALVRMQQGYTAFVHLLGPTDNPATGNPLWAQDDHQPGQGAYPTHRWFAGEIVLDEFRFVVPADAPPGEYTLSTGFYDPLTIRRLGRSDAEGDTAVLYRITVLSP